MFFDVGSREIVEVCVNLKATTVQQLLKAQGLSNSKVYKVDGVEISKAMKIQTMDFASLAEINVDDVLGDEFPWGLPEGRVHFVVVPGMPTSYFEICLSCSFQYRRRYLCRGRRRVARSSIFRETRKDFRSSQKWQSVV